MLSVAPKADLLLRRDVCNGCPILSRLLRKGGKQHHIQPIQKADPSTPFDAKTRQTTFRMTPFFLRSSGTPL